MAEDGDLIYQYYLRLKKAGVPVDPELEEKVLSMFGGGGVSGGLDTMAVVTPAASIQPVPPVSLTAPAPASTSSSSSDREFFQSLLNQYRDTTLSALSALNTPAPVRTTAPATKPAPAALPPAPVYVTPSYATRVGVPTGGSTGVVAGTPPGLDPGYVARFLGGSSPPAGTTGKIGGSVIPFGSGINGVSQVPSGGWGFGANVGGGGFSSSGSNNFFSGGGFRPW